MRIAVTGASGVLGRKLLDLGGTRDATLLAVAADLRDGSESPAAFAGVDAIIHAASPGVENPRDELTFMHSVVAGAKLARVPHIVYVSISRVDANRRYPYYAAKADAEAILQSAGIGYTIQRSAQFHELVDFVIGLFSSGPIAVFPPGAAFAPIAVDAVARRLIDLALAGPQGDVRGIAGPDVLAMPDLFATWKRERGIRKLAVTLPLPFAFAQAISGRRLIDDGAERIGTSWAQWLRTNATMPSAYAAKGSRRTK